MPSGYERSPDYGGGGLPPWLDVLIALFVFAPFVFLVVYLIYAILTWLGLAPSTAVTTTA